MIDGIVFSRETFQGSFFFLDEAHAHATLGIPTTVNQEIFGSDLISVYSVQLQNYYI